MSILERTIQSVIFELGAILIGMLTIIVDDINFVDCSHMEFHI